MLHRVTKVLDQEETYQREVVTKSIEEITELLALRLLEGVSGMSKSTFSM